MADDSGGPMQRGRVFFVAALLALAGCYRSSEIESGEAARDGGRDGASLADAGDAGDSRDASPSFDASAYDAGGPDGASELDPSGLACYPMTVFEELGGDQSWVLGHVVFCKVMSFGISEADLAGRTLPPGAQCYPTSPGYKGCYLFWYAPEGVNRSLYDELCAYELALGPREWTCEQYE